jgi:benzoyl-CoA reductase/2-hydroxyglutaryl-CoA dehydratase subunit BcrC/BadD/HgdB
MSQTDNRVRRLLYRSMTRNRIRLSAPLAFRFVKLIERLTSRHKVPSIRLLEHEYLSHLEEGATPGKSVWTSIFAPTEILLAFGLAPLCLEGLSALSASRGIADDFLGQHGSHFVPNTMCNFHRLSIDIGTSGLLFKPLFVMASSVLCDGNVKTFNHLAEETGAPFFFLDVPQDDDRTGVGYLVSQLKELITFIEKLTGKVLDPARLHGAAENLRTIQNLLDIIYQKRCTLKRNLYHGHQMINFMLPLNTMSGSNRLINICRAILKDLNDDKIFNHSFPNEISPETVKIVWAHIAPSFQYNEVWPFIDDGVKAKICLEECTRINSDDAKTCDDLELIARRLIHVPGNGPLEKRLRLLETIYGDAQADGIVHFSNWGCHQATGVTPLMQQYFFQRGIPFLNINGDCIDSRSCGMEQHKTRYSAFLESIASNRDRSNLFRSLPPVAS